MADLTGMMQAAAGAAGGGGAFIEDVFSCFLYTGSNSIQTITNGIDLDGEGGLVWIKRRNNVNSHRIYDTNRGMTSSVGGAPHLVTNENFGNLGTGFAGPVVATSSGFTVAGAIGDINDLTGTYVSWTFRKAPKFFDVVTYTGTGANRTVAHNLGSVPGSIWVKRTSASNNWQVYHRANTAAPETDFLQLNERSATADSNTRWNDTLPTDTVFTVGTEGTVNGSGETYVAYLFAHDDGGFGSLGTENAITCGSYVGGGAGVNVTTTLGYEPQWILVKDTTLSNTDWFIVDTMRGFTVSTDERVLSPNTSTAEDNKGCFVPTATGFFTDSNNPVNVSGSTYIFIAIRRGLMKVPTLGTSVFNVSTTGNGTLGPSIGYPDTVLNYNLAATAGWQIADRLRGFLLGFPTNTSGAVTSNRYLVTNSTAAESTSNCRIGGLGVARTGNVVGSNVSIEPGVIASGNFDTAYWFKRAPGYFDVVCYTGDATTPRTINHNLGVAPELIITKQRDTARSWPVRITALGNSVRAFLNLTDAAVASSSVFPVATYTSSTYVIGSDASVNSSGGTYVAYLFASLPGVQDIGSYTGNGTSLTVTTGFQPRFIMVKRTDSTGNWIVGDSARGLVAADDPFLLLNSSAAQTTNQDWVDVSATGFTVNETGANANVSTGVYLYWAIS